MIELCERFTYYGLSGPFQNYIQHSYNDPSGLPGAIGMHCLLILMLWRLKLMANRSWGDWSHQLDGFLSILVLWYVLVRWIDLSH